VVVCVCLLGVSSRRGVLGKVAGGMLGTLLTSLSLSALPGVRGLDGMSSMAISTELPQCTVRAQARIDINTETFYCFASSLPCFLVGPV
jgi:hypothetical protein